MHLDVVSRSSHCAGAAVVILVLLVCAAFFVAPRACQGGFEIYVQCGIAALIVLAALPFLLRSGNSTGVRVVSGLGLVVLGVAAWIAGLVAANVNFLCRLF
jgi:hypothetical protein